MTIHINTDTEQILKRMLVAKYHQGNKGNEAIAKSMKRQLSEIGKKIARLEEPTSWKK